MLHVDKLIHDRTL